VHGVGERRLVVPAGQVGLDRLQLRVAVLPHRLVVGIDRRQGGLLEALRRSQRSWVSFQALPPRQAPAVPQQTL
jgi:hypothetical protein